MIFTSTSCEGVLLVELDAHTDERGFFARSYCSQEFADHGIDDRFVQSNVSFTRRSGTLRGMHYEMEESGESKLVRCTAGAVWDVVVDVRPSSRTCGRWVGYELSRQNGRALYIPPGCAHGFLTLEDDVDMSYQMGAPYRPDTGHGFRWDDPAFGIEWPSQPLFLSERDASYPDHVPTVSRRG